MVGFNYTKSQLKEQRGWTDKLIRDLLGAPDETAPNWHHPKWPAIQLYSYRRVIQAERDPRFVADGKPPSRNPLRHPRMRRRHATPYDKEKTWSSGRPKRGRE